MKRRWVKIGIYITLDPHKMELNNPVVTNLLESLIFIFNTLKKKRIFKLEKFTIWKDGPNVAFGKRLKETSKIEEIEKIFEDINKLNEELEKCKLTIKSKTFKKSDQKFIDDFVNTEYKKYYGKPIIGINPFALELQGKLLFDNNQVPAFLKGLSETGFETELGDIYLDTFTHFGKNHIDFLKLNLDDFKNIISIMEDLYKSHIVNPKKIIIGEDQTSNQYCIGSIFFWYKHLEDYFSDLDKLLMALAATGKSETTFFLDELDIIDLWDEHIIEDVSNYRKIYRIENLRDSYSRASEMRVFIKKNATEFKLPVSLMHSFTGYTPNCNPKQTGLFVNNTIKAIHKILTRTLQKEDDFKSYIEKETNKILKDFKFDHS